MQSEAYDVAVVGGGVSGLGVARRAAGWGFKTVLFERNELGGQTSANSLRIIHGGFRYLQSFNIARVLESCSAQQNLIKDFPGLIHPLRCAMPLKRFGARSFLPVSVARAVYDRLRRMQGCTALENGEVVPAGRVREVIPELSDFSHAGALVWNDAVILNYSDFIRNLSVHANQVGAELCERSNVVAIRNGDRLATVRVASAGQEREVTAKLIINASGPWVTELAEDGARWGIEWCRAFNLRLNKTIVSHTALGLHSGSRLIFFVPRDGATAVGTWYLRANGLTANIQESEIEDALKDINQAYPGAKVARADVTGIESGLLPMKYLGSDGPVLYGREQIFRAGRIMHILSTKLTTFDEQAKRALVLARRFLA